MPDLGEDLLSEITALDGGDGSFTDLALGQMVPSTLLPQVKAPAGAVLKSCCTYLR